MFLCCFFSENQISDSDDTDAQTTSSHPESVETVVCNDEVVTIDSGEGWPCVVL